MGVAVISFQFQLLESQQRGCLHNSNFKENYLMSFQRVTLESRKKEPVSATRMTSKCSYRCSSHTGIKIRLLLCRK
ncbi:hypothetical protein WALBB_900005 [Wolbachia pipientis wAlbB]|nr:hypothetical protein WALBB_900005 [Wolbachia pipientis wAlbB]